MDLRSSSGEMPQVVYHYTSLSALMQIVKSKSLWATSVHYLNDSSERELFINAVRERLPPYRSLNPAVPELDSAFIPLSHQEAWEADIYQPGFEGKPFVTTFSQDADSPVLWRTYCPNGTGVSIGMKTECLRNATWAEPPGYRLFDQELLSKPDISNDLKDYIRGKHDPFKTRFRQVIYLSRSETTEVDAALDVAYHRACKQAGSQHRSIKTFFRHEIEDEACFYKGSSFAVEMEYRLLMPQTGMSWNRIHYRSTGSSLIPYVILSIPPTEAMWVPTGDTREHYWDAVQSVIVGPNANMELTTEAIKGFLYSCGHFIKVIPSSAPCRRW